VDAAAAGFNSHGMLQVKHLVIQEVLYGATGGVGTIEYAANDDSVVGGVVVAEHAPGVMGAPGEGWASEEAVKETSIETFEDLVEVVVMADMGENALTSPSLSNLLGLSGD
jgi:hypothetical protein